MDPVEKLAELMSKLTLSDDKVDIGPEGRTAEKNKLEKLLGDFAHLLRPSAENYKVVPEISEGFGHLQSVTFEGDDKVSPEDWLLTKQNIAENFRGGRYIGPVHALTGNRIRVSMRYLTLSDDEEEEGDKGLVEKTDKIKKLDRLLGDLAHLFRPSAASYKVVVECCEVLGYLKTVTFQANDEVSPEDWLWTKQNFTEHLRRPGHKLGPVYVQPGNKIVVCPKLPSLSDEEDYEGPDRKRARTVV